MSENKIILSVEKKPDGYYFNFNGDKNVLRECIETIVEGVVDYELNHDFDIVSVAETGATFRKAVDDGYFTAIKNYLDENP